MEFGIVIPPHSRHVAEDAKFAEDQGFTYAWFADEPVGHGDVFVSMALAAAATRELKVGAGIACASNRIAPATANSIATLNALAPGRVILGFGSGSGSRAALGLPPLNLGEVRKQLEVIRQLLSNGEATYEEEGLQRKIRFINLHLELIKLTPRIPLYVAASAPKMAALAGEFGDGFISFGPPVLETVTDLLSQARAGTRNAGRENDRFPCVWMTGVCVLRPSETLESPRVINSTGWWVLAVLKILALVTALDLEKVPPDLRPVFKAYADHLAAIPKDELHLAVSEGLYTLTLPEGERRFVTPEAIRAMALIGTRDEVIAQIKALEQAGVTQIAVATPFDGFREAASEISRELIDRV